MDYKKISQMGADTVLECVSCFDLDDILDCGQSFRWTKESDPDRTYSGVALGQFLRISQYEDTVVFHNTPIEDFKKHWFNYFDFGRDYGEIKDFLACDPAAEKAMAFAGGIRVLRQDPWETLCTFILSQNNNIPRIKGLVHRLCECFGDPIGNPMDGRHAFPPPERLAVLDVEQLAPVRAGFRAKYILDAAKKISSGEIDLNLLYTAPLEASREILKTICGVGPKVAECALLYGLGRVECFPVDVWIKRVLTQFYPGGFPSKLAPFAGIAQQYLFHYIRKNSDAAEVNSPEGDSSGSERLSAVG